MAVIDRQPSIRNLFKLYLGASKESLLELNIHQTSDLLASWLSMSGIDTRLVKENRSEQAYRYIRHVLALRYLHWFFGEDFLIFLEISRKSI